jgi:hypothetical protein
MKRTVTAFVLVGFISHAGAVSQSTQGLDVPRQQYGFQNQNVLYTLPMMGVGDLDPSIVAALRSSDQTR